MMLIIWLIVVVGVFIGVLAAILKWVFKSEEAGRYATMVGESIIVGVIIGFSILILLAAFEVSGSWFIGGFIFLLFLFVGIYKSGGPGTIYMLAVFVMIFGYMFAGPYSGYLKTYIGNLKQPWDTAMYNLRAVGHDLFLILTDPQEFLNEQQKKKVQLEKPTSYPRGIEFKEVGPNINSVSNNMPFFINLYISNDGGLDARNLTISATCKERCAEEPDCYRYHHIDKVETYWSANYAFGPFIPDAHKSSDVGKKANVEITVTYYYDASSLLLVDVMNRTEILNRLSKGESVFTTSVATGKVAPGMIAISTGKNPVYAGLDKQPLTVYINNKHMTAKMKLEKNFTELIIRLDETIGDNLTCEGGDKFSCVSYSNDEYSQVNCTPKKTIPIDPFEYEGMTCYFSTKNFEIEHEGYIVAYLKNYYMELSKDVGPTIESANITEYDWRDGICVNEIDGGIVKEYCGCGDSGCEKDDVIDNDCKDGGDMLCLEGDAKRFGPNGIHCCERPKGKNFDIVHERHELGQCAMVNLSLVSSEVGNSLDNLTDIWIRIDAETSKNNCKGCHNDLDVYGCYKDKCNYGDWKVLLNDIQGCGPRIIHIDNDRFNLSDLRAIDICSDPDKRSNCDHHLDWVRVKFKS